MPAWRPGSPVCVKVVSVFEANIDQGLANHLAIINLLDEHTGAPVCVLDGAAITAMRTAGAAMVSIRALARPDSAKLVIVGAGVQGREHLAMTHLALDHLASIAVFSRQHSEAEALAATSPLASAPADLEAAVREADVVCLCTHSYEPVIEAVWLSPGSHLTSVGYAPPAGEFPPELAHRDRLFVETMASFEPAPVGCPELAGLDPRDRSHTWTGALRDATRGGHTIDQITAYKAMGLGMEDLVAAELAWRSAVAADAGVRGRPVDAQRPGRSETRAAGSF